MIVLVGAKRLWIMDYHCLFLLNVFCVIMLGTEATPRKKAAAAAATF